MKENHAFISWALSRWSKVMKHHEKTRCSSIYLCDYRSTICMTQRLKSTEVLPANCECNAFPTTGPGLQDTPVHGPCFCHRVSQVWCKEEEWTCHVDIHKISKMLKFGVWQEAGTHEWIWMASAHLGKPSRYSFFMSLTWQSCGWLWCWANKQLQGMAMLKAATCCNVTLHNRSNDEILQAMPSGAMAKSFSACRSPTSITTSKVTPRDSGESGHTSSESCRGFTAVLWSVMVEDGRRGSESRL